MTLKNTTREELAWAAGLFEGEGCITFSLGKRAGHKHPQLRAELVLGINDRDIIERFQNIVGVGGLYGPYPNGTNYKTTTWRVGSREHIQAVIAALWPWFGERRRFKAREMLSTLKDRAPVAGVAGHVWRKERGLVS